jgi:hypothetical protein
MMTRYRNKSLQEGSITTFWNNNISSLGNKTPTLHLPVQNLKHYSAVREHLIITNTYWPCYTHVTLQQMSALSTLVQIQNEYIFACKTL